MKEEIEEENIEEEDNYEEDFEWKLYLIQQ